MTIQEKIAIVRGRGAARPDDGDRDSARNVSTEIHLWKEGVFWVAYEQNAYAIWLLKKYKPTRKFIKSVGMDVVSIGFPGNALASIGTTVETLRASYAKDTEQQSAVCVTDMETLRATPLQYISFPLDIPVDEQAFLAWKNGILPKTPPGCRDAMHCVSTTPATITGSIIEKIRNFDLSNTTPMEYMNFLARIRTEL